MHPELTTVPANHEHVAARAAELAAEDQTILTRRTDYLFAALLVCQWLAGIAAAVWISPRTWIGPDSSLHVHLIAAVFLGGVIMLFPALPALLRPGRLMTRHVI